MIVDKLENIGRYKNIIPNCEGLASFFSKGLTGLPSERTKIEGSPYVYSPFKYTTKLPETARWETHHTHMDIHVVIKGAEILDWIPAKHVTQSVEYVAERDVEFFSDTVKGSQVLVEEGYFALVMPEDAHKPAIANGEPAEGVKCVFKGDA
ncbi:MAG: YhcH/YjgK/YiaL family protein [Oscillospiraceae bacterium]|nr:YhcH/YjgK/YiaL family protein [Oscillospiraceae bacterium]